jgi:hypothetical protein
MYERSVKGTPGAVSAATAVLGAPANPTATAAAAAIRVVSILRERILSLASIGDDAPRKSKLLNGFRIHIASIRIVVSLKRKRLVRVPVEPVYIPKGLQ